MGDFKKSLIIFDFDGTLVDTAPIVTGILNNFRKELNLSPLSSTEVLPWISEGGVNLITKSLLVSDALAVHWLRKFRENYKNIKTSKDSLYGWVDSFLQFAKAQDFDLAICSNKPEPLLVKALNETSLIKFFLW